MLALYYFQGELGESLETPNAFNIPSPSTAGIKFQEFLDAFPNPNNNSYHFRFLADDKAHGYVWVDVQDFNSVLPVSSGRITAKILKLDNIETNSRRLKLRLKQNFDKNGSKLGVEYAASSSLYEEPSHPVRQSSSDSSGPAKPPRRQAELKPEDSNERAQPLPTTKISKIPPPNTSNNPSPSPAPTQSPPPAAEKLSVKEDLLFDTSDSQPSNPQSGSTSKPSAIDEDEDLLFGYTEPPSQPAPVPLTAKQGSTKSPVISQTPTVAPVSVTTVTMDIDDDSSNTAASWHDGLKAPTVSKEQAEMDEVDAAKAKHDKNLETWAHNLKEKRNIRTLLSSMHTVLWPGNTWKPVGLGDILDAKQVKLQYRKAMLVVHPDRLSNQSVEVRFIGKRVFEAINEAYQEFLKKESV